MFTSSGSLLLDYFRVPHSLGALDPATTVPERHPLRACGYVQPSPRNGRPTLWWFDASNDGERTQQRRARYTLGSIPIFSPVVDDGAAAEWLSGTGSRWTPVHAIVGEGGSAVGSIWRDDAGNVFLPFDPNQAIRNFWTEAYREYIEPSAVSVAKELARRAYYRARPALPRSAQIWARRRMARFQSRCRFPRWPIEPALHDLYSFLFELLASVAGEPVPWIAPWPHGHSWSFVLTHDVETAVGYRSVAPLRDVEARLGFRSSWNFVPERDYVVDPAVVTELLSAGWEVGVHGLHHDGRDLASADVFFERLPSIREHAAQWRAVGFRAPSMHRIPNLIAALGFEYDSSYPDSDPFEPQAGGCCSWLPYLNGDVVELPITLAQDHTLFVILQHPDGEIWQVKAEYLRARGGMALLNTHPDYMLSSGMRDRYARFLEQFADDESAWRALPREVARWWQRRAASSIERHGLDWRIVGPAAADGTVAFAPDGRYPSRVDERDRSWANA